jgi:hypothetical protein
VAENPEFERESEQEFRVYGFRVRVQSCSSEVCVTPLYKKTFSPVYNDVL